MIKTFTQTDLIRYLYRETSEKETTEIDQALLRDSELMALYRQMRATLKSMDQAELEPSASTVLNILNYSRSTQPKR